MPTFQHDQFTVGTTAAGPIAATVDAPAQIVNCSGGTLYYKSDNTVSSSVNDGSLTAGQSATVTAANWLVGSAPISTLINYSPPGVTLLTGGIPKAAALGESVHTVALDTSATLANYGTDAAAADNKTVYLVSLFVPVNTLVTGVATLNGTNITTDKIVNYLFNASGQKIGQSAATGTAPTPADTFQETDLTAAVTIPGPAVYFIGRQHNGTTIGFQSIPTAVGYRPLAGSVAGTSFGAETSVVPPTSFTAGKGPFGYLY